MTILWCGGEDIDFPEMSVSNVLSWVRSGYGRYTYQLTGNTYFKTIPISPVSSLWLSFRYYSYGTNANGRICGMTKSGTNAWIGFGCGASAGVPSIVKHDGSTLTVLQVGTHTINTYEYTKIDIQIINYGTNGTVNLYMNGVLEATYTGDISVLSQTTLDQIDGRGTITNAGLSEFIIADTDTRAMALVSLAPNATGSVSDWTGAYTDIDENTISDSDFISTITANQSFQCNLTNMPTGNFAVKAVKAIARASDLSGSLGLQLGIRTGTTVSLSSTKTLDIVPSTEEIIYQVNPETNAAFSKADIDALQLAYKSVAL